MVWLYPDDYILLVSKAGQILDTSNCIPGIVPELTSESYLGIDWKSFGWSGQKACQRPFSPFSSVVNELWYCDPEPCSVFPAPGAAWDLARSKLSFLCDTERVTWGTSALTLTQWCSRLVAETSYCLFRELCFVVLSGQTSSCGASLGFLLYIVLYNINISLIAMCLICLF